MRLRSDEQLVGLFRSGSEDAFSVIHDRYRQRLYAYSRQMLGGSGSDAEDVMQDVFLRAYRALRADGRPVSLRAWLYRVAHNRCVDHLRRPVPVPAEIFEMSRTPVHDPTVELERREDLQRLVADVRRLPDQQRSALLMREMDGMSYADLAVALETSVPAVKSLLVRARIGLVEAIEARDTDCADIRHDLAASYDRGVRASGRARRHLRDCQGCTRYRSQLREVRTGFAALNPSPAPVAALAKVFGLGGASSSAAAGGAAAVSVGKVAVVVCCAVAVTGGAEVVQQTLAPQKAAVHRSPAARRPAAAVSAAGASAAVAVPAALARHAVARLSAQATARTAPSQKAHQLDSNGSGGAIAPPDTTASTPPADTTGTSPQGDAAADTFEGPLLTPATDGTAPLGGAASGSGSPSQTGSGSGSAPSGSSSSSSGSGASSSSSSSSDAGTAPTSGSSSSSSSSPSSGSGSSGSTASSPPPPPAH